MKKNDLRLKAQKLLGNSSRPVITFQMIFQLKVTNLTLIKMWKELNSMLESFSNQLQL